MKMTVLFVAKKITIIIKSDLLFIVSQERNRAVSIAPFFNPHNERFNDSAQTTGMISLCVGHYSKRWSLMS